MTGSPLAASLALATAALLAGTSAQARFAGGGGFSGGGAEFRGGGGGGGVYRFTAPRVEAAPIERSAPSASPISVSGGGGEREAGGRWADQPADRSLEQGYQSAHPFYGSHARTSWTGHNISPDQYRRFNDSSGSVYGSFDNDRLSRNINLNNNFYNRTYGGWNNSWANGGYWGSRPWGYGWYSWSPTTWGWWGGSSVGWGLAALAGADLITSLVNTASAQQSPVIYVPESNYQLNYGSVDSVGSSGADFSYAVAGSPPIKGAANCQQGLLDGEVPSTAAQAQLLNAACQVAYGADPKGTPLPENLATRLPGWLRDLLVLALGAGFGIVGWGLISRQGVRTSPAEHHARVTGGQG